jgi:hypothetical protein
MAWVAERLVSGRHLFARDPQRGAPVGDSAGAPQRQPERVTFAAFAARFEEELGSPLDPSKLSRTFMRPALKASDHQAVPNVA